MVEWSMSGMSATNATCRSSSRNDQRACEPVKLSV